MDQRLIWGHININVSDLDASIHFYQQLGFELFMPSIPYLNLTAEPGQSRQLSPELAEGLGVPAGTTGRACIMQLGKGLPKLDLTELSATDSRGPLHNSDLGFVRLCLASQDLRSDYQRLSDQGVEFLSPPTQCANRLADMAICKDPDGTLIELLQVYLERWPRVPQTQAAT
jgi:catechol 2,3-dioxygenase-like lactoylglutathione lyase family enzyme